MGLLYTWRLLTAIFAAVTLGVIISASVLYASAIRRGMKTATVSKLSVGFGLAGAIATLIYSAYFRIHDLIVERPFNAGDVLGIIPIVLFFIAGYFMARDVGRALGDDRARHRAR